MRLLYWEWQSFLKKGVERAFGELGLEWDSFRRQLGSDWEHDEAFMRDFVTAVERRPYDAVFSINYNPMISDICEKKGLLYYSWVYDSPIHIRDISSLSNSCSRAYFFDRGQVEAYKKEGYDVRYLPLAGDVASFSESVRRGNRIDSEIAFVGQLYHSEYGYYMSPLDDYHRGYLEAAVAAQGKLYGAYILPELITPDFLGDMNEQYGAASGGSVSIEERELLYLLAQEVTARERYVALALLSNHFGVDIYTSGEDERLVRARLHPYIDYYDVMPRVFAGARINLNISLKCIRTGIPLRVFDVLSCGGFLITNYQSELGEYFDIGNDLVIYSDIAELAELCKFYLAHDAERERIAANGLRRVTEDFSVAAQLRKIFET